MHYAPTDADDDPVGTTHASSDATPPHASASSATEMHSNGSNDALAPPLLDLLTLTPDAFAARFAGTPIARIGRDRLVRNACVAAGNWGSEDAVPALVALLGDSSPLVRGHAAWALGRIGGYAARAALDAALPREADGEVQQEIRLARAV